MLTTVNVRCFASNQNGDPVEGATVIAKLSGLEVQDGYVLPAIISGETDETGWVTLALWPNELGATSSFYKFRIVNPETKKTTSFTATIPNTDCDLHLVANLPAYPGKTDGQLAMDEAIATVIPAMEIAVTKAVLATTQAGIATDKAILAGLGAEAAEASSEVAIGKAAEATADAAAVAADRIQTSLDSVATAADRVQTNLDRLATAADRVQTGLDAAATSADRTQTGLDSVATSTDADTATTQAGIATVKAAQTAADREQTGIDSATATAQANIATTKAAEASASAAVFPDHLADTTNPHAVTKAQVGLGSVDNTADADKPVSTAQATAIALKEPAITADAVTKFWSGTKTWRDLATDVRAITLTGLSLATGTAIAAADTILAAFGKLQKQITDNLTTLTTHTGNTGNPHAVTKAQVGLGSANDTSDANKPVSTAQQAALDLKVSKTSGTGAALLPIGPTAQRPAAPTEGEIRANSELKKFEGFLDGRYQDIGGGQMIGNAPVKAIFFNSQTIGENLTIAAGTNGLSAGPITISPGNSVDIEPGASWSIV